VYLGTLAPSLAPKYIFLTFSQNFRSRVGKSPSAFQFDRSLNIYSFVALPLLVFIARSTTPRNERHASLRGIRRLSVVVCHDVHQLRLERDRFSRTLPGRSRNRPRIPSPSDSNPPRGVCKCERVALYDRPDLLYDMALCEFLEKHPTRRRAPVSDNTEMENLCNDNTRMRYSNDVERRFISDSTKVKRGRRETSTILE